MNSKLAYLVTIHYIFHGSNTGCTTYISPGDIAKIPKGTVTLANNVYELSFVQEGIHFIHDVYGYPVKASWLKATRNNYYVGWPLPTISNIHKHNPETVEMPRGYLN